MRPPEDASVKVEQVNGNEMNTTEVKRAYVVYAYDSELIREIYYIFFASFVFCWR